MKTTLPILVLFVLLAPFKASQLNIKLKPLLDIPDEVDNDFAGFLFEPYEPSPSIPRTCYDSCPCGGEVENCGCGLEKVCGGSFPANLSAKDAIGFHYDASSDDTKYISIKGSGRTRIEFQGLYDCPVSPGIVEIIGTEIEFDIDDEGLDTSSQSYVYNAGESFIILGKCDGCSQCEIYTRLQFDPQNGVLDLNLKSLSFSGSYDSSQVVQGEFDYEWNTSGYCWMRDSQDRCYDGSLEESNTYEILDLPGDSSAVQRTVWLGICVSTFVALFVI